MQFVFRQKYSLAHENGGLSIAVNGVDIFRSCFAIRQRALLRKFALFSHRKTLIKLLELFTENFRK